MYPDELHRAGVVLDRLGRRAMIEESVWMTGDASHGVIIDLEHLVLGMITRWYLEFRIRTELLYLQCGH